ncbi:MAG: sigma-70 family RNA polymerase sigma factor [Planctomycetota bacterium]
MSLLPHTRRSLLLELGKRSDSAWAEFLEVYEHAIKAYCRKLGLQESDTDDATQEVLAAVHQRIPAWDHDESKGNFRSWLFRVTRNISIDLIIARARRAGVVPDLEGVTESAALRTSHEATLDLEYRRATLDWATTRVRQEVSVAAWQAFSLTAIHGQRPELVAESLGMSVGAVYTAKSRVITRLRTRVASLEKPEQPAHDESIGTPRDPDPKKDAAR